MNDDFPRSETVLEVVAPDRSRQYVPITQSPFLIGRGGAEENHLQLADARISRRCAAIVTSETGYRLENRGNHYGLFVNGARVDQKILEDGDVINFGVDACYEIVFHSPSAPSAQSQESVASLLTRIGSISDIIAPSLSSG